MTKKTYFAEATGVPYSYQTNMHNNEFKEAPSNLLCLCRLCWGDVLILLYLAAKCVDPE